MMKKTGLLVLIVCLFVGAGAQDVLFDFNNGPYRSSTPFDLTAGGITAHFTATGSGFSIQTADVLGFTPVGFSGLCVYPSGVFPADLIITFDAPLKGITLLYAPDELATDSSCTMLISAYLGSTLVGTNTATINSPGTWPTGPLSFVTTNKFDNVVIHYYKPPPTGGDYGPIFMVDNLVVTPEPPPPTLQISVVINQIIITWPTNAIGFSLQSNTNLANSSSWISVNTQPVVVDTNYTLTLPASARTMFYRLKQP